MATGWRRWLPWVLIVLAALIALVSALNLWVKRQALDTENWTNASSQLLENPQVRNAISVYMVNQLYAKVDVGQALEERLPPATKPLGPTIAAALEPALVQLANNILARPRFQELWMQANRRAHQLLIALLDGKHEVLVSTNGNVVLDLGALLDQFVAETGLGERIRPKIPPDAGQIVILKGNQLDVARKTVKVIRVISFFLSFVVLALFALAVYLARGRRRRMLLAAGTSIMIVGLIVLVVRRLAGNYLVDALTSNADTAKPRARHLGDRNRAAAERRDQRAHLRNPCGVRGLDRRTVRGLPSGSAGSPRRRCAIARSSSTGSLPSCCSSSCWPARPMLSGSTRSSSSLRSPSSALEILRRETIREFPEAHVPAGP